MSYKDLFSSVEEYGKTKGEKEELKKLRGKRSTKMRFNLKELKRVEKRIRDFIKNENRLPMVAMLENQQGLQVNLNQEEYCGLYWSMYNFWIRRGRFPNFVTRNVQKTEPTVLNLQNKDYTCGPATFSMISTKLFNPISEATFSNVLNTRPRVGTNPMNFQRAERIGFRVRQILRNPQAVREALSQYKGVIAHYETGTAKCDGIRQNYGHYAMIHSLKDTYYTVYDPTSGIFKCKTIELDRATNGRNIHYWSVDLV